MNYLIWKGIDSRDINGLVISELPPISKPQMRVVETLVDGVDGSVIEEVGYSPYDKPLIIGLTRNADIDEVIGYFTGEGNVIFSNEEEKYYKARIVGQIDYARLVRFRTATVVFRVQPFKYEHEEEAVVIEPNNLFDFSKWNANKDALSVSGGSFEITENSLTLKEPNGLDQMLLGTFSVGTTEADIETVKTFGVAVEPSTTYTLSFLGDNNGEIWVLYHNAEYKYTSRGRTAFSGIDKHTFTFETPATCNYITLRITNQSYGSSNTTLTVADIKIVRGRNVDEAIVLNQGNTTSKPIIEITGKGKISFGVNHNSLFEYTFPNGEDKVVIDSQKQDAYLETVLKNRNMVGEFPIFEAGENQVFFDGDIKSIKISSYSRWI